MRRRCGDVPLVVGDVGDPVAVGDVVERYGVDAVVHFAAYKSPAESMAKPQRYFGNNAAKSAALIETLSEARACEHVVFSSTCAVYGTPDHVPVGEDAPIHPESPYGESKAMTEKVLSWYGRCLDLRSVSLRYFNAAGAWPDGSIGEDWTVTHQPDPAPHEGRAGPAATPGGVRDRLPDAGRHGDPGLRAHRRPGRRPHPSPSSTSRRAGRRRR